MPARPAATTLRGRRVGCFFRWLRFRAERAGAPRAASVEGSLSAPSAAMPWCGHGMAEGGDGLVPIGKQIETPRSGEHRCEAQPSCRPARVKARGRSACGARGRRRRPFGVHAPAHDGCDRPSAARCDARCGGRASAGHERRGALTRRHAVWARSAQTARAGSTATEVDGGSTSVGRASVQRRRDALLQVRSIRMAVRSARAGGHAAVAVRVGATTRGRARPRGSPN